jgi:curved DNA-binding protein CbpA
MYDERAFKILGLDPTMDGRKVRAAYVRLARIYHPDRFADQPEDVRDEADRRMRQVTASYEYIRARQRELRAEGMKLIPPSEGEDGAQRYRQLIAHRHTQLLRTQARHALWDELEKRARERARRDADLAAILAESDAAGPLETAEGAWEDGARSMFQIRLEQAYGKDPLVVRAKGSRV